MSNSTNYISIPNLLLISIPIFVVFGIFIKWSQGVKSLLYATFRMVSQLILVGYALIVIFNQSNPYISSCILLFMLLTSSWIALRTVKDLRKKHYLKALMAIALGGIPVLILVVVGVVPAFVEAALVFVG